MLAGFILVLHHGVFAQDQRIADSLRLIYQQNALPDSAKLQILASLAFHEARNPDLALQYAEELINLATRLKDYGYLHRGYFQKGNKKRLKGDLTEAIAAYFQSIAAAEKARYPLGSGKCYSAIADIYSISNNHTNAMLYYQLGIDIFKKAKDTLLYATAVYNAGDELLKRNMFDSALLYFREAGFLFRKINYASGIAYNLGNLGVVYAHLGQLKLAEKSINNAISMLEEQEDYSPICTYLLSMSNIYRDKGNLPAAFSYAEKSLQLAGTYNLKDEISQANARLSALYEQAGNTSEALTHYKEYIRYRDSVNNIQAVQKMADLRTDYEVSRKQVEVDLLNLQKKNQRTIIFSVSAILLLTIVLLAILYWFYKSLSSEKKRSETLLLNILPRETARELKQKGNVEAQRFEEVTVLFTDFYQFSALAKDTDPAVLVASIDQYFKKFDEIISRFGLEKIKTIGDAYMCAGGLPTPNSTHASDAVQAAQAISQFVSDLRHNSDGLPHFEIRIGLHTGPVVAGIVGLNKWQYDIWGDTVNIAARMEANGLPGRINLSEATYSKIKDRYPCEYRGEIEVKNRGKLKMYFLA